MKKSGHVGEATCLSEIYSIYKKIVRCPFQSRSNRTKAKKASNSYKTIPFQ